MQKSLERLSKELEIQKEISSKADERARKIKVQSEEMSKKYEELQKEFKILKISQEKSKANTESPENIQGQKSEIMWNCFFL
jgi:uncharacterized protein YdaU (DUF1376 family)